MTRLAEIDKVYDRLKGVLPDKDKVKYCRKLIRHTNSYLKDNGDKLTDYMRESSKAIIVAARKEIKQITRVPDDKKPGTKGIF